MLKRVFFLFLFSPLVAFCQCDENPDAIKISVGTGKGQLILDQALSDCKAFHAQQAAYLSELNTLSFSLIGQTTGYILVGVPEQNQINAKMARISELRALLGI